MITTLAAAILATTVAAGPPLDTTLIVRPGVRLEVNNYVGDIAIVAWGRNAVRIEADRPPRVRTAIEASEGGLSVRSIGRMGPPSSVDYRISVPRWMDVKLSGVYTDMSVEGTVGAVSAETVRGDLRLSGGRGFIHLSSIQGSVEVNGASGKLEVNSVSEDVRLTDVEGDISTETVNGDIELTNVRSTSLEGATVNGDITFVGGLRNGGRYHFTTHDGDVTVRIPPNANAAVAVSTFSGDFQSSFPVKITETRRGKRFNFVLGSGGADLDLESFQGAIRLEREGERAHAKKED
jgi:DUF4097 and DUF4098 domain-containing protein YvlB